MKSLILDSFLKLTALKKRIMLSINIPVYNIDVYDLVEQILEQTKKLNSDYEIRVYDDASRAVIRKKNRKLEGLPNVTYKEMRRNVGRAAIRNKMGFESKFEYLLFIDADSKLISESYLEHYLRYAETGNIMCGGTTYNPERPADPEKTLRWYYGTHREAVSAQQKNRNKGFVITSNNFLIRKNIFKKIHFREDIKKYGHEDTMLGYDLFTNGYNIVHFDNPVEHTGLENAAVFLNKTKLAIGNLWLISQHLIDDKKALTEQVTFLNRYQKITRFVPEALFRFLFKTFKIQMENNLTGEKPKLLIYDFYKMCFYATIKIRA